MDQKANKQQRVDDKLLGRLNDEAAFEQDLAADPELIEILADTTEVMEAIDAAGDQALKARLQKLEGEMRQQKSSHLRVERGNGGEAKVVPLRQSFFRRHLAKMAAALALLLAAGYFLLMPDSGPNSNELLAANFKPYANIAADLTRGDDPTPTQIAFTAYEDGEYTRAADLLLALEDSKVNRFYAAQAYLGAKDYPAAAKLLQPLAKTSDFALQQESEWYLALALIGAEQTDQARSWLQRAADDANHPYRNKASELLRELDE